MSHVTHAKSCRLSIHEQHWQFAAAHATAVDAHWNTQQRLNPKMFNGPVYLLTGGRIVDDCLTGTYLRSEFKNYLYWRDQGFPETGVRDAFGSALIRSAEGHVILGRQRAGNMNAGSAYLPGGFVDAQDIGPDGIIDLDASLERELAEETGLAATDFARTPGYLVTFDGALISCAREFRSPLASAEIASRIKAFIAEDAEAELAEPVIIRDQHDAESLQLSPYALTLMRSVLATTRPGD